MSGAGDWCFAIKNTGPTNDVTALTVERFPLGTDEIGDGPTTVATDIPLAPGATTAVNGTCEPIATLRLTLTSASGTVVRIAGGADDRRRHGSGRR
ncbi:MAG: hypothetical protein JWM10_5328 [Myxococcaceae bacterium]|nr:hypothetical protein [Myxococcaceae bacterium]